MTFFIIFFIIIITILLLPKIILSKNEIPNIDKKIPNIDKKIPNIDKKIPNIDTKISNIDTKSIKKEIDDDYNINIKLDEIYVPDKYKFSKKFGIIEKYDRKTTKSGGNRFRYA